MTVKELIAFLKKQDQNLPVAYAKFSEYCMLEKGDIEIMTLSIARNDGWIQRSRPDILQDKYLVFPGN